MRGSEVRTLMEVASADAREGTLSVVTIEGESGLGKSRLLRRVARELVGFDVRRLFGEEGDEGTPYRLLSEMISTDELTATTNPLHATRVLTEWVDQWVDDRPLAYLIDDLQWVDSESVDALAMMARRSVHDRLLVVACFRPLQRRHTLWQRMMRDLPARQVALTGMDAEEVEVILRQAGMDPSTETVETFRRHTSGNPLYLTGLLREHDVISLSVMAEHDELPAPGELVAHLESRLRSLSPEAAALLSALAVNGDRWSDLGTVAAIADIDDAPHAARVLLDEGLIRTEGAGALTRARIYHAIVTAAIYDAIPAAERRRIHQAAAARAWDTATRLRHRVAAASGPDAKLSDELAMHARALQAVRQHRDAERYLRLAAQVSVDDTRRRDLIRSAEIEILLSSDPESVLTTPEFDGRSDPLTRLVAAMQLWLEGDVRAATRILQHVPTEDLTRLDPIDRYRFHIMRAHIATAAELRTDDLRADLAAAEAIGVTDAATQMYAGIVASVLSQRHLLPEPDGWAAMGRGIDRAQLLAQPYGAATLSFRGLSFGICGFTKEAIEDLTVVTAMIGDGTLDYQSGAWHAYLGFAYFLSGEWPRAAIALELARSTAMGDRHVAVYSLAPWERLAAGDPNGALASLEEARARRLRNHVRVVYSEDIVDVVTLGLAGTVEDRAAWRARRIADFGAPVPDQFGPISYAWLLAHGVGAAWAGEPEIARAWARSLGARTMGPAWVPQGVRWIEALAADADGQGNPAEIQRIAAEGFSGLDVFTTIALTVAVESSSRHGDPASISLPAQEPDHVTAPDDALGRTAAPAATAGVSSSIGPDPLDVLSQRERAVAQLVAEGMSYKEIARELYVTTSTVSFHLTRCYAKTNTASRHELARLVRQWSGRRRVTAA